MTSTNRIWRNSLAIFAAVSLIAVLTSCSSAASPKPYSVSSARDIWVALGGEGSQSVTGSGIMRDAHDNHGAGADPAGCISIEAATSGSPFMRADIDTEDPGMNGNLFPSQDNNPSSSPDLGAPTIRKGWYGGVRIFVTETAASSYMAALVKEVSACQTYRLTYSDKKMTPSTEHAQSTNYAVGSLKSVGIGRSVIFQDKNLVFAIYPTDNSIDTASDLTAFGKILEQR